MILRKEEWMVIMEIIEVKISKIKLSNVKGENVKMERIEDFIVVGGMFEIEYKRKWMEVIMMNVGWEEILEILKSIKKGRNGELKEFMLKEEGEEIGVEVGNSIRRMRNLRKIE